MYNINKCAKTILSFSISALILCIFTGCSSNQEMKTAEEQGLLNTEMQEEEHAHSLDEFKEEEHAHSLDEMGDVIEEPLSDWEIQEINDFNDFQGVLINIASTHPGTAGCSLQALYDARDLLNFCKAKLPFDVMAKAWAENLYDSEKADTHESFVFQLETLERLSKGDDKKEFDENDIENDAPYDKELYNIAINAVKTVINCTK